MLQPLRAGNSGVAASSPLCLYFLIRLISLCTYFKALEFPRERQAHGARVTSGARQPVLDFSLCVDTPSGKR